MSNHAKVGPNSNIHHKTPKVRTDTWADALSQVRAAASIRFPRVRLTNVSKTGSGTRRRTTKTVPVTISKQTVAVLSFNGISRLLAIQGKLLYTTPGRTTVPKAIAAMPRRLKPALAAAAMTMTIRTAAGGSSRERLAARSDFGDERT